MDSAFVQISHSSAQKVLTAPLRIKPWVQAGASPLIIKASCSLCVLRKYSQLNKNTSHTARSVTSTSGNAYFEKISPPKYDNNLVIVKPSSLAKHPYHLSCAELQKSNLF